MARKLTKPASKAGSDEQSLRRPFAPEIIEKAKEIALQYRIVLESCEDNRYLGSALEMPNVYGDGKTADGCVRMVRQALIAAVAYLLEKDQTPPAPASRQVRNRQVNIRLTETEQMRIRELAAAHGYTDLSDYVRNRSLGAH